MLCTKRREPIMFSVDGEYVVIVARDDTSGLCDR